MPANYDRLPTAADEPDLKVWPLLGGAFKVAWDAAAPSVATFEREDFAQEFADLKNRQRDNRIKHESKRGMPISRDHILDLQDAFAQCAADSFRAGAEDWDKTSGGEGFLQRRSVHARTAGAEWARSLAAGLVIHKVTAETRHFTFEGYGLTKEDADCALLRTLSLHMRDYPDAQPEFLLETHREADATTIRLGAMYRDGQEINWPEEQG